MTKIITVGQMGTEAQKKALSYLVRISKTIRKARKSRNMSQQEFGEFMGVSLTTISKWEQGTRDFSIGELCYIFQKLGISMTVDFCDMNGEDGEDDLFMDDY